MEHKQDEYGNFVDRSGKLFNTETGEQPHENYQPISILGGYQPVSGQLIDGHAVVNRED